MTSSPPHKRLRPADPGSSIPVDEAPVKALFAPEASLSDTVKKKSTGVRGSARSRKRDKKLAGPEPCSPGDILEKDTRDLLGDDCVDDLLARENKSVKEPPDGADDHTIEHVLRVKQWTISGDALAIWESEDGSEKWAVLVPTAHPGDLVRAKLRWHDRLHSVADVLETLEYEESWRGGEGDRRIHPSQGCKYFGECGGCQLQTLPYEKQLEFKRRTIRMAYQRYSGLDSSDVPEIDEMIPNPKQWGYRTKITPHFNAAPRWVRGVPSGPGSRAQITGDDHQRASGSMQAPQSRTGINGDDEMTATGANKEESAANGDALPEDEQPEALQDQATPSTRGTVTPSALVDNGAVTQMVSREDPETGKKWSLSIGFDRKDRPGTLDIEECPIATAVLNTRLIEERGRIQRTILDFHRGATLLLRDSLPAPFPITQSEQPFDSTTPILPDEQHVAVTDHKLPVYERVGRYLFTFSAGSFFQNSPSILVPLTSYVQSAIFPLDSTAFRPTHLVDAYCGCGMFGITLSEHFEKVAGVEISQQSIDAAKKNAAMNGLEEKTQWLCGRAEDIFGGLPAAGFEGSKSCVVVDPPRKGCDEAFLTQLLAFRPSTIVYVSCNVHTQARDIGWFVKTSTERGTPYKLESVRGFDLFPQTAHVESVAVLRRELI